MAASSSSIEIFGQSFHAQDFGHGDYPSTSQAFEGHVTALYDLAASRLHLPDTNHHDPLSHSPVAIQVARSPLAELGTRPLELGDYRAACQISLDRFSAANTMGATLVFRGLEALLEILQRGARSREQLPRIDTRGVALVSKLRFAHSLYPDADMLQLRNQGRINDVKKDINAHAAPLVTLRLTKGPWDNRNVPLEISLRDPASTH